MKIRIVSPGEDDRHERELRFIVDADGRRVSVTVDYYALFLISEALGMSSSEPLTIYAASGRLLNEIVADVITSSDDPQTTYFVSRYDVLRVTGSEEGLPHVPKKWRSQ